MYKISLVQIQITYSYQMAIFHTYDTAIWYVYICTIIKTVKLQGLKYCSK